MYSRPTTPLADDEEPAGGLKESDYQELEDQFRALVLNKGPSR